MSHTGTLRSGRARMRVCSGSSTPLGRESTWGEPERLAQKLLEQEALLVGGLAAGQGGVAAPAFSSPVAAAASARSQLASRSAPPSETSGWVIRSGEWTAW